MASSRRGRGPSGRIEVSCRAERWGRYPFTARSTSSPRAACWWGAPKVDAAVVPMSLYSPLRQHNPPHFRGELLDASHQWTRHVGRASNTVASAVRPAISCGRSTGRVSARGQSARHQRLSERAADVVVVVEHPTTNRPARHRATERTCAAPSSVRALRKWRPAGVGALGGVPAGLATSAADSSTASSTPSSAQATDTRRARHAWLPRGDSPGAVVVAVLHPSDTDFALALKCEL